MYSSPFLHQRELTELFAAHDTPVCPRHSQTAGINGIATHQETLSTATPKRPAAESPVSKVLYILAQYQKSKGRQPTYTHRRPLSVQQQSFYKGDVPPHRNMTMSARKVSFTELSIAELRFCCTKIVIF